MYEYVVILIYNWDVDLSIKPLLKISSPNIIIKSVSIITTIETQNYAKSNDLKRQISKITGKNAVEK